MALPPDGNAALYAPEPCPYNGNTEDLARWAANEFIKLQSFFRRPDFPVVVWAKLYTGSDQDVARPQDGMMIYAAAGVVGGSEGFYVREAGVWRKIAGT